MNEEEKKAIHYFDNKIGDFELLYGKKITTQENEYLKLLLNLINKQQKEIETLKESQFVLYGDDGNIVGCIRLGNDVVSKDKIKEKIEELKEYIYETEKKTCGRCITIGEDKAIQILRELLGE